MYLGLEQVWVCDILVDWISGRLANVREGPRKRAARTSVERSEDRFMVGQYGMKLNIEHVSLVDTEMKMSDGCISCW